MIHEIGKHKVKHGDVMDGIADLMGGDKADIFYSDPPWGQGNLRYWQTINNRHTGAEKKDHDLTAFVKKIFEIAMMYSKQYCLIEYGRHWKDEIIAMGTEAGFYHIGYAECDYLSGSKVMKLHLYVFAKNKQTLPASYYSNLKGTHGMNTLRRAMSPFVKEGGIVLDPCCGMGYTAQFAKEYGMIFRGNELNSKRLQKTIERLQDVKGKSKSARGR